MTYQAVLRQHGSLATPTKILRLKLNKEETKKKKNTFLNQNIHAQRQGVHVARTGQTSYHFVH